MNAASGELYLWHSKDRIVYLLSTRGSIMQCGPGRSLSAQSCPTLSKHFWWIRPSPCYVVVTVGDRLPFFAQDTMANRNINSQSVARIRLHYFLTSRKIMCHLLHRNKNFQSSLKYNCVPFTCWTTFVGFICLAQKRERVGGFSRGGPRRFFFPTLAFPSRKMEWFQRAGSWWAGGASSARGWRSVKALSVWCPRTPRQGSGKSWWVDVY